MEAVSSQRRSFPKRRPYRDEPWKAEINPFIAMYEMSSSISYLLVKGLQCGFSPGMTGLMRSGCVLTTDTDELFQTGQP